MRAEGFAPGSVRIDRTLDMRYAGQSYDLTVPFAGDYVAAFHRAHEQRYGYSDRTRSCEVATFARASRERAETGSSEIEGGKLQSERAVIDKTNVCSPDVDIPHDYDRGKLQAGNRIFGPAIVTEYSATTAILPLWTGHVDSYGNLILEAAPMKFDPTRLESSRISSTL